MPLVENTSTEFMAINISRALGCIGLRKEVSPLGYRLRILRRWPVRFTTHISQPRMLNSGITFNSSPEERTALARDNGDELLRMNSAI